MEATHPFYPIDEDPLFRNELGLDELYNIEEFICEDLVITYGFRGFLNRNQYSLTCLDIHLRWSHNVFSSLAAIKNLKRLRVSIVEEVYRGGISLDSYKHPNSSALPMLEELEISYTEDPDFADYQYARDGEEFENSSKHWMVLNCDTFILALNTCILMSQSSRG